MNTKTYDSEEELVHIHISTFLVPSTCAHMEFCLYIARLTNINSYLTQEMYAFTSGL